MRVNLWAMADMVETGAAVERKLEASISKLGQGRHALGHNLYLDVRGGSRNLFMRYLFGGRQKSLGLGPWPVVTLAEARQKVLEAKRRIRDGHNPIEDRKQARAVASLEAARRITFAEAADQYIREHQAGWRSAKHAEQWPSTINRYVNPKIGTLPLQAITTDHILDVLRPIWKGTPETASRIRGRIEKILAAEIAHGRCPGPNVARWRGHLDAILVSRSKAQPVVHHAAIDWRAVPRFMTKLRTHDTITSYALQFLILTASRSSQGRLATWDEIDTEAAIWSIPNRQGMKGTKLHRVPLPTAAIAIIRAMGDIRHSRYVFPGLVNGRPLGDAAITALLRRMGYRPEQATTHGFRASFRTWSADHGYPADLSEAALAHSQGKLHDAYQRGDLLERRREMMAAWAAFLG
jgi:integrase